MPAAGAAVLTAHRLEAASAACLLASLPARHSFLATSAAARLPAPSALPLPACAPLVRAAGTLVFPKNKYLVLRMGQKDVLCEGVLESMVGWSTVWAGGYWVLSGWRRCCRCCLLVMQSRRVRGSCQHCLLICLHRAPACMPIRMAAPQIVFSEGWWVGSAEDNPEEKRLPDPDWLAADKPHTKFDYSGRGGCAP